LKKTALNELHHSSGAKMVEYAGYDMPLSYTNIKDEYLAVRSNCGVFDVSHMQVLNFSTTVGENQNAEDTNQTVALLNLLTVRNVSKMKPGRVQYNILLNSEGGIIDDITLYRQSENEYYMISNASRASIVLSHIQKTMESGDYSVEVQTFTEHCLIALQGPESEKIICNVFPQHKQTIEDSGYYRFASFDENDGLIMIARTGYTGEDGFEIFISSEGGKKVWKELDVLGVQKCGLAARDLLRMEVFYPLYGNELSEEITPYEASLDRLVDESKEFIGKPQLLVKKESVTHKTRGIIMQTTGAIPRQGYIVYNESGETIGKCTSGGFSFTWNQGFGLVSLDEKYAEEDQTVWVEIRGQKKPGIIKIKSPLKGSIKRKNG